MAPLPPTPSMIVERATGYLRALTGDNVQRQKFRLSSDGRIRREVRRSSSFEVT